MSEMGDDFKAIRAIRTAKKNDNLIRNKIALDVIGVPYEEKNFGTHLIIRYSDKRINFYPSTGLFKLDGSKHNPQHRGIRELLVFLGIQVDMKWVFAEVGKRLVQRQGEKEVQGENS
jgi:hypothetical protein